MKLFWNIAAKFQARRFRKMEEDMRNPNGVFMAMVKESLIKTNRYLADRIPQGVKSKQSKKMRRIVQGVKKSWDIQTSPYKISVVDEVKLSQVLGPYNRSIYNSNIYKYGGKRVDSFWQFILHGWAGRGGFTRTYKYPWMRGSLKGEYVSSVLVFDKSRGSTYITSPFNPKVGKTLKVIREMRHKGKEPNNWYQRVPYKEYFVKQLQKGRAEYLKSFGIKK